MNLFKRMFLVHLINNKLDKEFVDGWDTGVIYIRKNYFKKGYSIHVMTEDYGDFKLSPEPYKYRAMRKAKKYASKIRKIEKEGQ